MVFEARSHVPVKEAFYFERITEGLKRSGCYLLQYTLQPAIPEAGSLTLDTLLEVQPGTAASFGLQVGAHALAQSRCRSNVLTAGSLLQLLCWGVLTCHDRGLAGVEPARAHLLGSPTGLLPALCSVSALCSGSALIGGLALQMPLSSSWTCRMKAGQLCLIEASACALRALLCPQICSRVAADGNSPLQGEGRAALASRGLMLGEQAPPLTVQLKDAGGNEVPAARPLEDLRLTMQTPEGAGDLDLRVRADQVRQVQGSATWLNSPRGRWSCIWLAAVGSRQET